LAGEEIKDEAEGNKLIKVINEVNSIMKYSKIFLASENGLVAISIDFLIYDKNDFKKYLKRMLEVMVETEDTFIEKMERK